MKKTIQLKLTAVVATAAILGAPLAALAADNDRRDNRQRMRSQQQHDRMSFGQPERLNRIMDAQVFTSDRERVGKINNVVLDLESGSILFAVINTQDGRVAVPPGVFANVREDAVRLNITKNQLRDAPKVSGDMMNREQLAQASFVNRVHEQFGQRAWWRGEGSGDSGKFNNVHTGDKLIGMKVQNVIDRDVGEVRNALIDLPAGRVVYVAIEPERGLGLGDRLYALPPSALTLGKDGKSLVSDLNREKMTSAPSFARGEWPSATDRSFASKVYSHYGKRAYFESGSGSDLQPTGRDDQWRYEDKRSEEDRAQDGWRNEDNKENRSSQDGW